MRQARNAELGLRRTSPRKQLRERESWGDVVVRLGLAAPGPQLENGQAQANEREIVREMRDGWVGAPVVDRGGYWGRPRR